MRFKFTSLQAAVAVCAVVGVAALIGGRSARGGQEAAPTPLPTGRALAPTGTQTGVGSYPAGMALSPDGKWLVVTDTGYRESLSVLRASDGSLVSQQAFNAPRSGQGRAKTALYVGLAFAPGPNGTQILYASRGPKDKVSLFSLDADGKLTDTARSLDDPWLLATDSRNPQVNFVAGIALNADGSRLYVVNNETSLETALKGSVSVLDTAKNTVLGRIVTPGFPYAVAAVTRGANADKKIYVSSERDGVVSALDVTDPAHGRVLKDIRTGDHPMALALDAEQKRLFVANAGSDTVSVIDTASDRVLHTLSLHLNKLPNLPGETPTGLALSPDESRLYVTLGDANAIAVVDLKRDGLKLAGAVPAGWYPTAVVVSKDGSHLFVANAKGVHTRNPNKEQAGPNGAWGQYIENIIEGTVSSLPAPAAGDLPRLTAQVTALAAPFPAPAVALPPIKHVVYILKENRTYDQVLGDLPQGNGDANLTLFGRTVTPNLHALAERFVLLDNFYDCAEVSADGWNWSTSGMTSEYAARNVPFNYSGRGRSYDFEGQNNGAPVDLMGLPDVNRAPGGYIWDLCAKKGVSYRGYGFFVAFADVTGSDGKLIVKDNEPSRKALTGHTDADFRQFDMDYADSDAWKVYAAAAPKKQAYGQFGSSSRYAEWKREFDGYVKGGDLPAFSMVRFPRDHTAGTRPGSASPRAMVADNDYAVGQLVEAISRSPYWKDTAIFVIEDDAQDGYDHVDAHRSVCFVISPYIRRGAVDHHFYNTDSVLHTMERLLGLPPMCQYDALATIIRAFGPAPDNAEPFAAILPGKEVVTEVNDETAYRAQDSLKLDFSRADQVPDDTLNDILWHSIKGAKTPKPRRASSIRSRE